VAVWLSSFTILSGLLIGQGPVAVHGNLSTLGNRIVDCSGNTVSLAGMSLFWSNTTWGGEAFYNAQAVQWLRQDWNIAVIRASMGVEDPGGFLTDPSNQAKVETVVDAAIQEGLYVIIDWHSHHAEQYQQQAITFFTDMATQYGSQPNVIYEIYNEPLGGVSWSNTIKPYAQAVIAAIRAIDPDNLIVVGTPTWSQDVDVASQDPITGYANIAYALHFYAATHTGWLRQKALVALNNGVPLFVTEWGTVNAWAGGSVAYQSVSDWMQFLCEHKISHCNWALNDKPEAASALVPGVSPTGNWTATELTPSGTLVKSIVEDWSITCPTGLLPVESVRLGTPPNPTALLPGATQPRIGMTWDPGVDHSVFLPNAISDGLFVAAMPANVSASFGTVLLDESALLGTLVVSASAPFLVSLPYDCSLIGLQLSAQAASFDGSALRLTNALDITIGQ